MNIYAVAADAVLLAHFGFVVFVVAGLLLILVGGWRGWRWVRRPLFRWAHLAAIAVVAAQAWLGVLCPLTILEMNLREAAGEITYGGSFVAHWVGRLLYWDFPWWVFAALYSAFLLAVGVAWWRWPPARP